MRLIIKRLMYNSPVTDTRIKNHHIKFVEAKLWFEWLPALCAQTISIHNSHDPHWNEMIYSLIIEITAISLSKVAQATSNANTLSAYCVCMCVWKPRCINTRDPGKYSAGVDTIYHVQVIMVWFLSTRKMIWLTAVFSPVLFTCSWLLELVWHWCVLYVFGMELVEFQEFTWSSYTWKFMFSSLLIPSARIRYSKYSHFISIWQSWKLKKNNKNQPPQKNTQHMHLKIKNLHRNCPPVFRHSRKKRSTFTKKSKKKNRPSPMIRALNAVSRNQTESELSQLSDYQFFQCPLFFFLFLSFIPAKKESI